MRTKVIQKLMSQEMNRRDFLLSVTAILGTLVGFSGIMRALRQAAGEQTKETYNISTYGQAPRGNLTDKLRLS